MCIGDTSAAYCLTCCGGSTSDCLNCPAATCNTGDVCTPVTGHDDSVCVATSGAMDCQACGNGTPCLNSETCIGGVCHASCNPQYPGTCPGCAAESALTGLCVCDTSEIHSEGQPCGISATLAACAQGLICAGGTCARPCVVGDASSCPTGQACVSVGGVPACVTGSAGGKCDACNGMTCNGGFTCFQGRCYGTCNVSVKNGPCDSSCVDVGGGLNVCACDDQIGGVGSPCGGSPVGACSSGLLCIQGHCESTCDPNNGTECPILTQCGLLEGTQSTYVCQPIVYTYGGGGGTSGGTGGGRVGSGGGVGGGGSDSGCGCGASPGALLLIGVIALMRRRKRGQATFS
jgi:hypothetical protein